jgi:hypothetical protein
MMPEPKPREEHVTDADRIIADSGPDLQLWLADQGLAIENASTVHWGSLTSSLKAAGKRDLAEDWIAEQKAALVRRWKVTRRGRTAGEICRRFLAAKMDGVTGVSNRRPMLNDLTELEILPDYIRWVIPHPDAVPLEETATEDEKTVRAAEAKRYERKHRAPNQAAVNYLEHIRRDKQARQKMFDEAKTFLIEHRKKSKKELVSETDHRENQRVLDMKAERDKLAEKYASARMPAKS